MLRGFENCPSPLPEVPHFAENGHARLAGGNLQSQPSPTERWPQTWPAGQHASVGHVPPHAGASEIAQVLSGLTQVQVVEPDACPQSCPSGHVPPHAGASEMAQVLSGLTQVQVFDPEACPQS